jgi:hypothetical protein
MTFGGRVEPPLQELAVCGTTNSGVLNHRFAKVYNRSRYERAVRPALAADHLRALLPNGDKRKIICPPQFAS